MLTRVFLIITLWFPCVIYCYGQKDKDWFVTLINVTSEKINREGSNPEYLNIRGWAYYSIDSVDAALKDYNEAIRQNPNSSDLFFRRADIEFDMKNYRAAIGDYTIAISISPDSLDYYVSRGASYEKISEFNLALKDYDYVLERNSFHEFALWNRAVLYCYKLNDAKKGFTDFDNLIRRYPQNNYDIEKKKFVKKKTK